jgi:hypothetical protein
MCLKGQCYEIFYFKFFRESAFFGPLIITLALKFRQNVKVDYKYSTIAAINCSTVSTAPAVYSIYHWRQHHRWSHLSKIYINRLCG